MQGLKQLKVVSKYFDTVEATSDYSNWRQPPYVLYSLSTSNFGPPAYDPQNPGIRIYGLFETHEDALKHGETLNAHAPYLSMFVGPRDKWLLLAQSTASLTEHDERVQERLAAYDAQQARNKVDVQERMDMDSNSQVGDGDEAPLLKDACSDDEEDTVGVGKATVHKQRFTHKSQIVPRTMCDPEQAYMVCYLLNDLTGSALKEPLLRIDSCFETAEIAEAYVRNHLSQHVLNYNIIIAKTNKWVHIESFLSTEVECVYRDKELDQLMKNAKTSTRRIKELRRIFMHDDPQAEAASSACGASALMSNAGSSAEPSVAPSVGPSVAAPSEAPSVALTEPSAVPTGTAGTLQVEGQMSTEPGRSGSGATNPSVNGATTQSVSIS